MPALVCSHARLWHFVMGTNEELENEREDGLHTLC